MTNDELEALAGRVEKMNEYGTCVVDVLVEIAMFKPGSSFTAIRPNAAGTKVIYTDKAGNDVTCCPEDWTVGHRRQSTAAALRTLAQRERDDG